MKDQQEIRAHFEQNITNTTSVEDRIKYINEHGNELNTLERQASGHQKTINRLLDGVTSDSDRYKIIGTLIDQEWKNCKDVNPATFMRSQNLFKTAIEQPMNWALEKDPSLYQKYIKDPMGFIMQNYKMPEVIQERFKTVLDARRSDENFNLAEEMHKIVFATINGPMVKHANNRMLERGLDEPTKLQRKNEYMSLIKDKSMVLTDCNMVYTGVYETKMESMLERGRVIEGSKKDGHIVTPGELDRYDRCLESLARQVDPNISTGAITDNKDVQINKEIFIRDSHDVRIQAKEERSIQKADELLGMDEKQRHAFESESKVDKLTGMSKEQRDTYKPPSAFEKAWSDIKNFFKKGFNAIGDALGKLFKSSPPTTEVGEKASTSKSSTEESIFKDKIKTKEVEPKSDKVEKIAKVGQKVVTDSVQKELEQRLSERAKQTAANDPKSESPKMGKTGTG